MKHSDKFALATTISLFRKTEKRFDQILVEPGKKSPLGVLGRLSLGHWYGLTRLSLGHWSGLSTRLSLGYVLSKVPVSCV